MVAYLSLLLTGGSQLMPLLTGQALRKEMELGKEQDGSEDGYPLAYAEASSLD